MASQNVRLLKDYSELTVGKDTGAKTSCLNNILDKLNNRSCLDHENRASEPLILIKLNDSVQRLFNKTH